MTAAPPAHASYSPASNVFGKQILDRDGNRICKNMSVYANGVVWNVQHALRTMIILNRTQDDGRKMTMLLGPSHWRLISVQGWYAGEWPSSIKL